MVNVYPNLNIYLASTMKLMQILQLERLHILTAAVVFVEANLERFRLSFAVNYFFIYF